MIAAIPFFRQTPVDAGPSAPSADAALDPNPETLLQPSAAAQNDSQIPPAGASCRQTQTDPRFSA